MIGDEGLLVSGRAIRAEERLHLEDTKRRSQQAAGKAPSRGQRGSRRWRPLSGLPAQGRGPPPPEGPPGPPRGSRLCRLMAGGAQGRHGRGRRPQGHHHQGLRVAPDLSAPHLAAHPPAGLSGRQGAARGDQGGARERAGDVVHLPGVPQGRPQAEGALLFLPALRAYGPPRSGRCPKHRRPGRRIHACDRTRHAPSGRTVPARQDRRRQRFDERRSCPAPGRPGRPGSRSQGGRPGAGSTAPRMTLAAENATLRGSQRLCGDIRGINAKVH